MSTDATPPTPPTRRQRLKTWATKPRLSMTNTALVAAIVLLLGWNLFHDPYQHQHRLETSTALDHDYLWTTLGTNSGPIARADRSEPANLLWNDDDAILVDAGDGAAEQLAKIDVPLEDIDTILISHLHIDHTGGLFALIGMRLQTLIPGTLTIMGPPGTQETVDGILASLESMPDFGFAGPEFLKDRLIPDSDIKVIEVSNGDTFALGTDGVIQVTAAANSHYGPEGEDAPADEQSLSYRFDMADRSIVFTGDTGPSDTLMELAEGADLLVSEITDVDQVVADLHRTRDLPRAADPVLKRRFASEHLTAEEVAKLATTAGVGSLVITHNPLSESTQRRAADLLARGYDGPVAFAEDLQHW